MGRMVLLLLALLACAGCTQAPASAGAAIPSSSMPFSPQESAASVSPPQAGKDARENASQVPGAADPRPQAGSYIRGLARERAGLLVRPGMEDAQKVEAAYRWMVESVYFADPPAPEIWQWCCLPDPPPSYLEVRALCPLAYGVGSCEDFAAALALILQEMGFRADYVSGLTISVDREWVDHAWTVVQLGGQWYHLDSQLEQNVTRGGQLAYRYFLRGDIWMQADHLWGAALASYWEGMQTPEQRRKLLEELTPPICPSDFGEPPQPKKVSLPSRPDTVALQRRIASEKAALEEQNGTPAQTPFPMEPPLFSVMP